ncbi:hypothetical protein KSW85_15345 [Prevotella copri]|uniref:hypothetical protein n=1 Tax=Segatella copri TaxID=165179 RepID=UPI001C394D48|nr:hypothetical protein [Segatella copri]MBV3403140.1 hypothetical protein [Segatella copri]
MTLKVGNVTRAVSSYSYDDIGRLVSVKRSGNAGIVKYDYNIRNWLKETKSDRFSLNLWYESTGAYPCFNGNISRMQWQTSKDNVLRVYDFAYDGLNRLEESTYAEGAGMSQNKNRYSENILSYSPNGSIERLQRYGKKNNGTFGLIDDLMYSYNGNQIKAISDKAGSLLYDGSFDFKDGANADVEYFYDTNGALIKDLNKGISNIEYDVLGNLYGHAYFYELKQKNPSIEPSHTFGVVGYVKEFDPYFNQVVSYPVFGKNNTELEEQINIVEQQAIDNYEKNNR